MSLGASFNIARSSLAAIARETSVLSRNTAIAGQPFASRKLVHMISIEGGGVRATITRASNSALFDRLLTTTSAATQSSTIVDLLSRLNETVGDPALESSPAALVGKFRDALQTFAEAPDDDVRAQAAVASARTLANSLNGAADTVQQVRAQADAAIGDSVDRVNALLAEFEEVNRAVVNGTHAGADVTDQLDQRDRLLASLSEEIGIRTVSRPGNDMAIYTDSGVTLFDQIPRQMSFQQTSIYDAGTVGHVVYADGVPITGDGSPMPVTTGRVAALADVRDKIAPAYQSQLDEIARGLIEAFAETDQAPPAGAALPGLFTFAGATGVPAPGALVTGLAGGIAIAASVDPEQGGDPMLLRDGNISGGGADYVYNASGAAGFSDRIRQLVDEVSAARSFDSATGLQQTGSITDFASSSAAWLQQARQLADTDAEQTGAMYQHASQSLSNATGINLDEEMARLLELERAHQASSRLITTIDDMYAALFQAMR